MFWMLIAFKVSPSQLIYNHGELASYCYLQLGS